MLDTNAEARLRSDSFSCIIGFGWASRGLVGHCVNRSNSQRIFPPNEPNVKSSNLFPFPFSFPTIFPSTIQFLPNAKLSKTPSKFKKTEELNFRSYHHPIWTKKLSKPQ